MRDVDPTPLVLAGLRPGDEPLYRLVLRNSGIARSGLAELTGTPAPELDPVLERFRSAGLVHFCGDTVVAVPPAEILVPLARDRATSLLREFDLVDALRDLIPQLVVDEVASLPETREQVDVEAVGADVDAVEVVRSLLRESSGDVLWFRPDQWRLPLAPAADRMVSHLRETGRRSRAIYPAAVLEHAPEVLRTRAAVGELVRVTTSLPVRLAVFSDTAVFITDRWGPDTGRRLIVREHSLVGAVTALFESVWERALAVPGLDIGADDDLGERRLLLHQLTRGAKDEQIARALGISLRTVRRRVAEVMEELGATSRFQAGVEAVRRGWI
ncbi:MAG TPA: helix-turn-helix transcriptional regulator [Nocardioidaceae bacterium]